MTAYTPAFGPTALLVPAAHRKHVWSYRHGVHIQQHGEPMRTNFTSWDQGDVDAYQAGYRDAASGAIRQKGVHA